MSCLSLSFLQQLCINIIIISAIVAFIRLLLPYLTNFIGIPIVGQLINIILWAIVAIFCVYIIFGLLGCLVGGGGFHIGSMR